MNAKEVKTSIQTETDRIHRQTETERGGVKERGEEGERGGDEGRERQTDRQTETGTETECPIHNSTSLRDRQLWNYS